MSPYASVVHAYNVLTPLFLSEPQNHHRKQAEQGFLSPLHREEKRGLERGNDLPSSQGHQG